VSRFSKPAPPARAKRLQWKTALRQSHYHRFVRAVSISAQ
jgi:hypothetical protein